MILFNFGYCISIVAPVASFAARSFVPLKMSLKRKISTFFQPLAQIQIASLTTKKAKISDDSSTDCSSVLDLLESPSSSSIVETESSLVSKPLLTTLVDNLEEGWKSHLTKEKDKPYFKSLDQFLEVEFRSSKTIYPPREDIFSAFKWCPFDTVKVVIIGQDPYHGPNQAHGLAFSVRKGVVPPPSLKNIITELKNDPELKVKQPNHGYLESWSHQGVLLLNTVMTVRQGEANSHQKHGWEEFTDAVVRELGAHRSNIVYLLWGNHAQMKIKNNHIDCTKNHIITCSHPSPLGAYKTNEPFMNSRCFSTCNKWLVEQGIEPIDWNIK